MDWQIKVFAELTTEELYEILRLRNEVFVVEQDCVYQDADGKDQQAFHVMGLEGEKLVAYSRIFAPGIYFENAAIGRVITAKAIRGQGIGKQLMQRSMQFLQTEFPNIGITISAQQHLQAFYGEFGFKAVGEGYLEDGIPHVRMARE